MTENDKRGGPEKPARPWLALRGKGRFKGEPFAPVVENSEIDALNSYWKIAR